MSILSSQQQSEVDKIFEQCLQNYSFFYEDEKNRTDFKSIKKTNTSLKRLRKKLESLNLLLQTIPASYRLVLSAGQLEIQGHQFVPKSDVVLATMVDKLGTLISDEVYHPKEKSILIQQRKLILSYLANRIRQIVGDDTPRIRTYLKKFIVMAKIPAGERRIDALVQEALNSHQ
ncbi:MAG: hypothetical protein EBQ92_01515 [Proteobacteria bacterium]|nr:hypothetical protein [Pseudomonadota bacterium]